MCSWKQWIFFSLSDYDGSDLNSQVENVDLWTPFQCSINNFPSRTLCRLNCLMRWPLQPGWAGFSGFSEAVRDVDIILCTYTHLPPLSPHLNPFLHLSLSLSLSLSTAFPATGTKVHSNQNGLNCHQSVLTIVGENNVLFVCVLCECVCLVCVCVTNCFVYPALCGCMGGGESVYLVNNVCAFSSLWDSLDLFTIAVCATAETEGGQQRGGRGAHMRTDVTLDLWVILVITVLCLYPSLFLHRYCRSLPVLSLHLCFLKLTPSESRESLLSIMHSSWTIIERLHRYASRHRPRLKQI